MGNTRTLKATLEYDGTDFAGWQVQPRERTVQQVVESALERILGERIRVTAAGRTDAGVHAKGQVISFTTSGKMETGRLRRALNGVLPRDVTVTDVSEAPEGFNARFDAVSRTYRYTLSDRRVSIGRNYVWHVKYSLSKELLAEATAPLEGSCSLKGFSKGSDGDDFSTIILKKTWTFRDNLMIFEICAARFFHHAVRSMVGTAVEIARGRENPDLMKRILETGDRSLAGPTAPASGLCLMKVDYGESR